MHHAPLQQGDTHSYCVAATGRGPLIAQIAYYDYPGSPVAAKALVNDLDLRVTARGLGNATLLGNGFADDLNPAERVRARLITIMLCCSH